MQEPHPSLSSSFDETAYEPPRFEVIPLDCEITGYAPVDDDRPLI